MDSYNAVIYCIENQNIRGLYMNNNNIVQRDMESLLAHYKARKSVSFCCSVLKDKKTIGITDNSEDGRINSISHHNSHLFKQYLEHLLTFIENNKTNIIDAYYQGFDDCMALIGRNNDGILADSLMMDNE